MNLKKLALASAVSAFVVTSSVAITSETEPTDSAGKIAIPAHQLNNDWFVNGAAKAEQNKRNNKSFSARRARNVILFVGDGMGVSTVTAARILEGQLKGKSGEENNLSFELFSHTGMSKTYNVDAQTPDSAGTATAMFTGVKTDAGVIGVDEDIVRGDCSTLKGNELTSALELAEISGKATGLVSTARITHATPASGYAKSPDRNWEDVSDMPEEAIAQGCVDIATQLVEFEKNLKARYPQAKNIDGLEVAMGGGRRHFLPKEAEFNSGDARSEVEGDRTDGRHLVKEWMETYPQGTYVMDQAGFDAIDTENTKHLFGLFNESHMQYHADRENDIAGEPSLTEMTSKAIQVLNNDRDGFFLMVEAGRIDHGHHAGSAYSALHDTVEFSNAVQAAVNSVDMRNTLIIVTADHSHVFTIAGYPKRGNPILGKVVGVGETEPTLADDGKPFTTLGYTNGRGFQDLGNETDADAAYDQPIQTGRDFDLTNVDTESPGFHQEALVPRSSETHGGEDVTIYAKGPGANMVIGSNEQNVIFHVMNQSARLESDADRALDPEATERQWWWWW